MTGFRTVNGAAAQGPDSPQPATTADPDVAEGYIVGPDNQLANRLDVLRVTNPGGTPSITTTPMMITIPRDRPAAARARPGDHRRPGRARRPLLRGDDRRGPRWERHASGRPTTSGSTRAGWEARAAIATPRAGTSSGISAPIRRPWSSRAPSSTRPPPTRASSGCPSIAMNGQGHASLNTSTAGNGRRAEVAGSGRLASDPLGTTEAFDLIQSSNSGYNLGSAAPRRWGDYSQTVVDPTDNQTFWTFQEYTSAQNVWGVRVIQLKAPPPADPASRAPEHGPDRRQSSARCRSRASSTGGSGFFDTRAPTRRPRTTEPHLGRGQRRRRRQRRQPSTDPTHLTLDLDTSARNARPRLDHDHQPRRPVRHLHRSADRRQRHRRRPTTPNPQGTSPASPANNNNPKVFGIRRRLRLDGEALCG